MQRPDIREEIVPDEAEDAKPAEIHIPAVQVFHCPALQRSRQGLQEIPLLGREEAVGEDIQCFLLKGLADKAGPVLYRHDPPYVLLPADAGVLQRLAVEDRAVPQLSQVHSLPFDLQAQRSFHLHLLGVLFYVEPGEHLSVIHGPVYIRVVIPGHLDHPSSEPGRVLPEDLGTPQIPAAEYLYIDRLLQLIQPLQTGKVLLLPPLSEDPAQLLCLQLSAVRLPPAVSDIVPEPLSAQRSAQLIKLMFVRSGNLILGRLPRQFIIDGHVFVIVVEFTEILLIVLPAHLLFGDQAQALQLQHLPDHQVTSCSPRGAGLPLRPVEILLMDLQAAASFKGMVPIIFLFFIVFNDLPDNVAASVSVHRITSAPGLSFACFPAYSSASSRRSSNSCFSNSMMEMFCLSGLAKTKVLSTFSR